MDALAASPFALLDAHSSLHFVIDIVHEDDALCLALACRAMRDALGARFPACPRAGGRAVARLAAKVTADGVLDLSYDRNDESDGSNEMENEMREMRAAINMSRQQAREERGLRPHLRLRTLPEGLGRLAYLPAPGLRVLDISDNKLTALPAGLWTLVGLAELILSNCGLQVLPEGIGRLVGLRKLYLNHNEELTALPVEALGRLGSLEELHLDHCPGLALEHAIQKQRGLPAVLAYLRGEVVEGVAELDLSHCGLMALPEGIGRLAGLKKLDVRFNINLTALPEGLCTLSGLEELDMSYCRLTALPEGVEGLTGLRTLDLTGNRELTTLPAGLGRLRNLEGLRLYGCPELAALRNLHQREGQPALLAHLAAQGELAVGETG
jgi:hypothetical protein